MKIQAKLSRIEMARAIKTVNEACEDFETENNIPTNDKYIDMKSIKMHIDTNDCTINIDIDSRFVLWVLKFYGKIMKLVKSFIDLFVDSTDEICEFIEEPKVKAVESKDNGDTE